MGEKAVDPRHVELVNTMVEKHGRFGRKNGKGRDYPAKPAKKHLWPDLKTLYPQQDPDKIDVQELKNRFHATTYLRQRAAEEGVVTDMREADVGSILGFRFAPFTGGAQPYRRHGHDCLRRHGKVAEIWRTVQTQQVASRHGEKQRVVLRALQPGWGCEESCVTRQSLRDIFTPAGAIRRGFCCQETAKCFRT
ncbi:MAG: hypothetical protein R3D32_07165 [Nitratireductor sp.]